MNRFLLNRSILLLFCLFCLGSLNAQEILIKDINPGVGWGSIDFKFRIGDNFYFVANSDIGNELWVSNGTPVGTIPLKDINAGSFDDANPDHFIQYNGIWYFTADDGINGIELWQTDGTESGTVLFADIQPGMTGSEPSNFTIINGLLYFTANDGTNGTELWKSDGTLMGTVMVADIFPGVSGSSPEYMVPLGTDIVFVANDGTNGKELWKTDGTAAGTSLIADIVAGASSSFPTDLTTVASKVYFIADDGVNGKEIWRTDGTAAGTELTTDIVAGAGDPQANNLRAVGDYLFFVGDNGVDGVELFRSDANAIAPLSEMVEIFPDSFGSTPKDFIMLNGDLMFNANRGGNGFELWKANASDGSVGMVKDIFPGFGSSSPVMLAVLNNELIFRARGELIGFELWKSDGTDAGTVLLGDLNTDPSTMLSNSNATLPVIKDNVLYFTATDYINGFQIWRTDGTTSATQRLTSIPHDTIFNNSHKPYFINNIGNEVINFVGLSAPYGEELWGFEVDPVTIGSIETNSPLNCNGDTNGTIAITVTGGVGDPSCFNYSWNNGMTGLSIADLVAGSYILTVSDCVGFETITTVTIEEPDAVSGTTMETSGTSCAGDSDGQASVSGAGGTSPYNYLWDNGQTGPTVTGLSAGMHGVTITDNNGCTGEETVLITEPTAVTAVATAGPVICSGANNGTATVVPGGGTPGYFYLWDNNEASETAIMLTGGNHTVTVTDTNGCVEITTVTISELPAVTIEFIDQHVSCINGNNGAATVLANGGSGAGYTYLWEDGSTMINLMNLAGGTYAVTVTDDNGCTAVSSTTILTPLISATATGSVSCFGGADGTASVAITNANSTYTYLWDNGETTGIATMLNAGVHTVTITDALACSTVEEVTVEGAPEFVFVDSLSASPSCFGAANGFVTYNFSGGTGPYTYNWSTGDVTNDGTLTGLSGDMTYCATITDANNCETYNFCSTLTEPIEIASSVSNIGNATCFATCDGTVSISVMNGVPGASYVFTWSSGETNVGTTSTAVNLCTGNNEVTITDGTCSVIETYPIFGPPQIIPTVTVTNVTCFGETNGSVSVSAIGGIGTLEYDFSNGETDLAAGTYTVTITDANNCQITESFTITQPDLITFNYDTQSPSCIGGADGSVTPLPFGGTGPFTFEYSDGPTDLAAGTYMITATDVNGCQGFDSFTIGDPAPIEITSAVTNISCFGEIDGSVVATATGGSGAYSFEYSSGDTGLAAGMYMVTATDDNGCTTIDSFMVTEPDLLTTTVMTTDVVCLGDANGTVSTTASGGTMPYLFSYSDGIDNLAAGTYFVTTTDDSGCTHIDTFDITEPDELLTVATIVNDVSCFGGNDGGVVTDPIGGTAPYTFDYSAGPDNLTAGTYMVTVTDASGCEMIDTFEVTEPMALTLSTSATNTTGSLNDGTATAVAGGGTMPYTYEWNTDPVQTTETAVDLAFGEYEVTVTDGNGCTISMTVMVDMTDATVDLDERLRFDLYPNPADGQVILDLEFLETLDVDLTVFNVLGQMVYSKALTNVSNEKVAIELKGFTQGIYWVQLKTGEAQFVKKLNVIRN